MPRALRPLQVHLSRYGAMLTFHPLELSRRQRIAEDAVCLDFRPPPELTEAYRFEAGQHIAVRAMLGGRELRRTYSIVSAVGGGLRIGVRIQGQMSKYLAETLQVGDRLEALEPTGRFKPTVDPAATKYYVALAAGRGITPVLSIVGTLLAAEPASRVFLVYGNRSIARTMFVDELMSLKDCYLERFTVHFVMSREPQDVDLFNGRLDGTRLRELARTEFDPRRVDEFFICGPGAMVTEVSTTLGELGATGKIHIERFSIDASGNGGAAVAAGSASHRAATGDADVGVRMDGRRRTFRMAPGLTILESAEVAGLALPYSCRAGVCSTCRVKVVNGTVTMDRNQALEDWEVLAGYVLCCQSRPTSDSVELSYDEK